MSNVMLTRQGPFAGVEVQTRDLFDVKDHEGNLMMRDGQIVRGVPVAALTPIFLELFDPKEGWGVTTEHRSAEYTLPDPWTLDELGRPLNQPTEWITVSLVAPNGRTVAQASSLAIVNGPKAFERGETIARSRLYEALGLPRTTAPLVEEGAPASIALPKPVAEPVDQAQSGKRPGVVALPSGHSTRAIEAPATPVAEPLIATVVTTVVEKAHVESEGDYLSGPPKRSTLAQLSRQAKLRGRAVPSFSTEQEARAFQRELLSERVV